MPNIMGEEKEEDNLIVLGFISLKNVQITEKSNEFIVA